MALAVYHAGQSDGFANAISIVNFVCTIVFIVELLLKMLGLGWRGYFSDSFNVFDFIIVLLSIVELGLGGGGTFAAFRAARIFR